MVLLLCGSALAECVITTICLPKGKVGEPYTAMVQTSGCGANLAFSTADGALPAGLEWAAGGKITGTPTREGWYCNKATVKGSAGLASAIFWTEIVGRVPSPKPADTANGKRHQVTLRWDAPVPAPNNYSVYRAASASGPYEKVASGITARTWNDSVQGGTTYYYVVTAVASGLESICSQAAKAVVP